MKEVAPLLPDPCHFQDYDRSMFPLSLFPRDAPQRFARMKLSTKTKDNFQTKLDQGTDPIQEVYKFDRHMARTPSIDLSFPQEREKSDHGDTDLIQVSSLRSPNELSSPSGCM